MTKLSIEDLDLNGRRVLIRVDFNVPIRQGQVDSDKRVVAALPTVRYASEHGASVILMSHLGRPKGERHPELSLQPVADRLSRHLDLPVAFAEDCVGPPAEDAARKLQPGEVLLLENLRFHPGEEKPDREPGFAAALAGLGERYVNDAFGTAHRAHASMVAVAERFDRPAAGFLMKKEIDYLGRALTDPERPFVAVLGGAKVSDKILLIESLLDKVDQLLIGGAMAYTFLAASRLSVGASRVEEDKLALARELLGRAAAGGVDMLLPRDHVCGRSFEEATPRQTTDGPEVPPGWIGLDIGPATLARYREAILLAGTVVWNGPMGVFEWPAFAEGTLGLARACAESSAVTIVGGGDSASAAERSGVADKLSHISTGGGASLELLEGKVLPGVAVLTDA